MGITLADGVFTVSLDLIASTTLAAILLMFGYFLRSKVAFFEKYCFPAPVIGGFTFALLTLACHVTGTVAFKLDTTLQTPFMLAFFTTIGLGGSLALLKTGGRALVVYLVACWFLAILQNTVGVGLAEVLGIHPLLGIMAGAVSLEGGHGAAATFGPEAEALGATGAAAVAIASATFGLIAGSLTGGPMARWLISRDGVAIEAQEAGNLEDYTRGLAEKQAQETVTAKQILYIMTIIGIMMVFGVFFAGWVKEFKIPNFFLPSYVGAMFGAIALRNLNDKYNFIEINGKILGIISDVSIGMFLSFAMMSLRIWDLVDLALPLLTILVVQVGTLMLLTYFVLFRMLGGNYDAAVMCAGIMGHGLGATPNAVANMGAVCEHYGVRSTKAFLVVPLCGAVLIDIVAIPCISLFIGFFGGQ